MADESITRMNLSAIKKIDPYAKEIVDSSSHVAFYTFNSAQNEWEKTDVEGAFFIYHRNAEPFHSIFINNRLNTTSFVEPITGSLELQSQPPFLLYRNERSRIRGFWFYNSEECDRISSLVNGLLKNRERGDTNGQVPRSSAPTLPNPKPDANASIFNMLSKAQKEYNAQVSGQPKTPSENVTAGNVLKFFESAKQATVETQFHRVQPLSVDQLEKQQRAATPGEDLNLIPSGGGRETGTSESRISPFQKVQPVQPANGPPLSLLSELKIGQSFVAAPSSAPSSSALMANDDAGKCLRRLLAGDKPALMPPTMFDAPSIAPNGNPELQPHRVQPLNSTQFVQAFTYLIQNDKEFVNKLHKAYLNGCSSSSLLLDASPTYQ